MALSAGIIIYVKNRPAPYNPDEKPQDITSSLASNFPTNAPNPKFVDVTARAGLSGFRNFAGNRTSQLPEDMGPGLAWGDFDNDGDDDLFVVSAGGALDLPEEKLLPCALYENLGNGTFRKVEGFPETRIHGMGAAWGDYDGDGYLDLVVSGYNALLLFHNEHGSGKFVRDPRLPNPKGFWSAVCWGDFNNDRALDLYVCGYVQYQENPADLEKFGEQVGTTVPYTLNPASYLGGTNMLFRNNLDETFTDVAPALKVTNSEGRSLGALWHDFDDDGWLDLYVANDVSDNVFYHNVRGKFEDISHPAYVADYRSAMGLAAGDFNRDGDDDLFVTHWVAQENALYENFWADFNLNAKAKPAQGTNSASKTYSLRFTDIADQKGLGQIGIPFVGWGTEFVDLDNDGWLDLLVANGNTLEFEGPRPKKLKPQESFFFWNDRGEFFHNLAPLNKSLSEQHNNRGLAAADYDNDGRMDIAIAQLGEGVQLLHNEMKAGNWLKVRLRSKNQHGKPLGFGDGAKVIAHLKDAALRRTVSSVSYLSQSSHTVHFGLGAELEAARFEVRWLGGGTNFYDNLKANTTYEIVEGDPTAKPVASGLTLKTPANPAEQKANIMAFWAKQRAAMDAMKIEKNNDKAISLFREALVLNPEHEDSLYYLGHCLAAKGDIAGGLEQLEKLTKTNPRSHRAFQERGTLMAIFAKSQEELKSAEVLLEKAHSLNPEETGALLTLGEVSLLLKENTKASERFAAACRTNPKAVGGFFLRGYLALKAGDEAAAKKFLQEARTALGKEWQPKGATSEGDVQSKQHVENTPLTRFWEQWDGRDDPARSFQDLDRFLQSSRI